MGARQSNNVDVIIAGLVTNAKHSVLEYCLALYIYLVDDFQF